MRHLIYNKTSYHINLAYEKAQSMKLNEIESYIFYYIYEILLLDYTIVVGEIILLFYYC